MENSNSSTNGCSNTNEEEEEPAKKRLKVTTKEEENSDNNNNNKDVDDDDNNNDNIISSHVITSKEQLKQSFLKAKPYSHGCIKQMFNDTFLKKVLNEIKNNTKVKFKESDLFRVYQSIDLGNLNEESDNSELCLKMPSLMKLKSVIYSKKYRNFIEHINNLPKDCLTDKIDCAANCHTDGCHLLCHDDVIGTRKVSYIIYLTDPEDKWTYDDGGCLELYDSYIEEEEDTTTTHNNNNNKRRRIPNVFSCKRILPEYNSMAYFVVQPGVSFHSVQEVFAADKPRLSIQGWYHTSKAPQDIHNATLSQLKESSSSSKVSTENDKEEDDTNGPFTPMQQPLSTEEEEKKKKNDNKNTNSETTTLSEHDRTFLSEYINETYLQNSSIDQIRQQFEEESSVQLRHFFNDKWISRINKSCKIDDYNCNFGSARHNNKRKQKETFVKMANGGEIIKPIAAAQHQMKTLNYVVGLEDDDWKAIGPPHKQRYLEYVPGSSNNKNGKMIIKHENTEEEGEAEAVGPLLYQLKHTVMQSNEFGRFLQHITSLGMPLGYRGPGPRRFRPGMDYTVAHYGILTKKSVLDATCCFCAGTGNQVCSNDGEEEEEEETKTTTTTTKAAISDDKGGGEEEKKESNNNNNKDDAEDDDDAMWESGDYGGFECYIEADDEEDDDDDDDDNNNNNNNKEENKKEDDNDEGEGGGTITKDKKKGSSSKSGGPADEYNDDDDTELLSVSASNNTLSLVYRDPGTMRFIKYVGNGAPSSRWDISMEYDVLPIEEDDDDEEEDDNDN